MLKLCAAASQRLLATLNQLYVELAGCACTDKLDADCKGIASTSLLIIIIYYPGHSMDFLSG